MNIEEAECCYVYPKQPCGKTICCRTCERFEWCGKHKCLNEIKKCGNNISMREKRKATK